MSIDKPLDIDHNLILSKCTDLIRDKIETTPSIENPDQFLEKLLADIDLFYKGKLPTGEPIPIEWLENIANYFFEKQQKDNYLEKIYETRGFIDEKGNKSIYFTELEPEETKLTIELTINTHNFKKELRPTIPHHPKFYQDRIMIVPDDLLERFISMQELREGKDFSKIYNEEKYFFQTKTLPPESIFILEKIAQEGDPSFAQLISKLINFALYGTSPNQPPQPELFTANRRKISKIAKEVISSKDMNLAPKRNIIQLADGILGPGLGSKGLEEAPMLNFNIISIKKNNETIEYNDIVNTIYEAFLINFFNNNEIITKELVCSTTMSICLTAISLERLTSRNLIATNTGIYEAPSRKAEKAQELLEYFLEKLTKTLGKDIEKQFTKLDKEINETESLAIFYSKMNNLSTEETLNRMKTVSFSDTRIKRFELILENQTIKNNLGELERCIDQATELAELVLYYKHICSYLKESSNARLRLYLKNKLKTKIINKFKTKPENINHLLKNLTINQEQNIDNFNYGDTNLQMFEDIFLNEEPSSPYYNTLFDAIINPNHRTYYNACIVIAHLFKQRQAKDEHFAVLAKTLFSSLEDVENTSRLTAYRDILSLWKNEKTIMKLVKAINLHTKYPGEEKAQKYLGLNRDKKPVKPNKKTEKIRDPLEGLNLLQQFPTITLNTSRNLDAQAQEIIENRSIQINDTGNQIKTSNINSPLAAIFPTAIVKKDNSRVRQGHGLYCNITFYSKDDEKIYCSLNHEGKLTIRILKKGTAKGSIEKKNALENHIDPEVFDELNYLALSILEIIYLKKPKEEKQESTIDPNSSNIKIPGNKTQIPETLETGQRKEGKMLVDLSTKRKNLEINKSEQEKQAINSNIKLAKHVFAAAIKENTPLNEIPNSIEELVIYKKELLIGKRNKAVKKIIYRKIDAFDAYVDIATGKLDPKDVYIRTGRAHSKPLPYLLRYPSEENPHIFSIIKSEASTQAEIRHELFIEDGNEALDKEPFDGFLTFETDITPKTELLAKTMRCPSSIRRITEAKIREFYSEAREEIEDIKEEILKTNSPEKRLELSQKIQEIQKLTKAKIEELWSVSSEIPAKIRKKRYVTSDDTQEDGIREELTTIELPQYGFNFNQTFNQGQFTTLAKVLELIAKEKAA